MSYAHERLEFSPPPAPGMTGALVLALLSHALLILALSMGVQWRNQPTPVTVEAELWSALPQIAALPPTLPEPAPETQPVAPTEPPEEAALPLKTSNIPAVPDPQIVQEKIRLEKEKLLNEKLLKEKQQNEKIAKEQQDKLNKEKQDKEKREKEKLQKEKEQQVKLAKEKAQKDKASKEKPKTDSKAAAEAAKAETKQLEELRQQNLKRIAGMAGGAAAQSSGPSAEYAGRIRARIRPNITYTDTITGNPTAEVEVRTSSDGTIISRKIAKSSGVKSWDEAVLAAIDKTEILPRDVDGKVPGSLVISFRPRD